METGENWFRSNPMSLRDVVAERPCYRHRWRLRNPRTEARMRASPIVMRDPLAQDLPQLPFMERDDVVETFSTRRPIRRLQNVFACGTRTSVLRTADSLIARRHPQRPKGRHRDRAR
jgi:hypothetical protein